MSLRGILERIWNDATVRCPKHVVRWSDQAAETSDSGRITNFNSEHEGLFWGRGKRVELAKPDAGIKRREAAE